MLNAGCPPVKPFAGYKWRWASLQCTEGLNDPVILLGILFRMRKLELSGKNLKYSSPEFAEEMKKLSADVSDSLHIDLAGRTGGRNIIRNSGQYWKALGLIPENSHGIIRLTDFGRRVADRIISQAEFSAEVIRTFRLPNPCIQSRAECAEWHNAGISVYPLTLLLRVLCGLSAQGQGYITPDELVKIIIPLAGMRASEEDYADFIIRHRSGSLSLSGWPDCAEGANDFRIAREYLLFLHNYGYAEKTEAGKRGEEKYSINQDILPEIEELTHIKSCDTGRIRAEGIISEIERKRIQRRIQTRTLRPNQARFRREVLKACGKCVITGAVMPEILEAAHIKPFSYSGEDTAANGLAMRADVHALFDAGHLRISPDGRVMLSGSARKDYGSAIPDKISIPDHINRDFLRWRWENYNGI